MPTELLELLPRVPMSVIEPGDLPSAPKPEPDEEDEAPQGDKPK